jgi:hypothetical protein
MTTTYDITGEIHSITLDSKLATLTRSSDPYTRDLLEKMVGQVTRRSGNPVHATLTRQELTHLAHEFGEQYAEAPCDDLDRYFDILNNRWRRHALATHSVQHYLFGGGKSYRASISALCSCGEALAGHVMRQFNYTPIVRPLGIMPDLLCDNGTTYCLTEAKSSVASSPGALRDKSLHQFLVDVKTRATGFYYAYEAYLVCAQFQDGGKIGIAILHVDATGGHGARRHGGRPLPKAPDDQPEENLDRYLRLAATAGRDGDRYLAELLHDEAVRAAILAQLTAEQPVNVSDSNTAPGPEQRAADVEGYVQRRVHELDLTAAWKALEEQWPDLQKRRRTIQADVAKRVRTRKLSWE